MQRTWRDNALLSYQQKDHDADSDLDDLPKVRRNWKAEKVKRCLIAIGLALFNAALVHYSGDSVALATALLTLSIIVWTEKPTTPPSP